jgi:hypothetical protein
MLRAALRRSDDRSEVIRIARVVRALQADAISELGEYEGHDLVGATLQYVHDRVVDVFGEEAWQESARSEE